MMINVDTIENLIRKKALELGYESCGIISVEEMKEYAERLNKNVELFPELKAIYKGLLYPYAEPLTYHEWAKSIIICVSRYGQFKLENISNRIGKHYWFDTRKNTNTEEYSNRILFDQYLSSLGLKAFRDSAGFGTTAYKWAAQKAGLGIIRKNCLFYTEKSGSWVIMDAWLVDKEMELLDTCSLNPCPDACTKCQDACRTKALKPYAINAYKCISYLTGIADDLPPEELREKIGECVYGCDACQDACPMNKNCLSEEETFPDVNKIAERMSLENIFNMDDATFTEIVKPKFWYISDKNRWKWKVNSIIAMVNNFESKYEKCLKRARDDKHEKVREIATWACVKLNIV
jgi:epoxyqueuosine reductase